MGRKLIAGHDRILDAALYVVGKEGAAQLTIDAVARRAGISKATVLYSFKSKRALIEALIQRCVAVDTAHNEASIQSVGSVDAPVIHGRIRAAAQPFTEASRAVGLNLCAAIAQDPGLRKPMQEEQRSFIQRVAKTSAHPRGALLAHVALEGVKLLELLDFHSWRPAERNRLLQDIAWLAGQDPHPKTSSPAKYSTPPGTKAPARRRKVATKSRA